MEERVLTEDQASPIEISGEEETIVKRRDVAATAVTDTVAGVSPAVKQKYYTRYVLIPFLLLTVALLGGLRLDGTDGAFIFVRPPLVCLIFAAILLVLFFRAGLLRLDGWLSESLPPLKNAANAAVLISLFAASTQLFNSLIPERGLPFWIVGFCFFWTLWNNLFAEFETRKLLRSLGALFGLAFVVKYLLLANLAAPPSDSWLRSIIENPAQEAATWLLDLPRFSAGTGYIQFFTVVLYLLGLFMIPHNTVDPADDEKNTI